MTEFDDPEDFAGFVCGRTVCFVCHGHSLAELERRAETLRELDVCWGSLNRYTIAEQALGRRMDFVVFYNPEYAESNHPGYVLRRSPNRGNNSLYEFLQFCELAQINRVVLFGADGWCKGPSLYKLRDDTPNTHVEDCKRFNERWRPGTVDVRNCSPGSKYQMPEITYDDCIELGGRR